MHSFVRPNHFHCLFISRDAGRLNYVHVYRIALCEYHASNNNNGEQFQANAIQICLFIGLCVHTGPSAHLIVYRVEDNDKTVRKK